MKKLVKHIAAWVGRRNPELVTRIRYRMRFHKKINLDNPQTLNEKIQYLSLRTDTTEWSRLTDKYEVREYVKERGLENILNKLYGVWSSAEDIPFADLPEKFVLKATHGSGDSIIVTDRDSLDFDQIRKTLNRTLSETYGLSEGNPHYSRIVPRIVAEELLENDPLSAKYSNSLIDYKIWCFNGKARYVWACTGRTKHSTRVMTYDTEWNAHPEYSVFNSHYMRDELIPRPENLELMLQTAEKLAGSFPVVRVDLYNLAGKIYFGEMTFTSLAGLMDFYTEDFLRMTGSMIQL